MCYYKVSISFEHIFPSHFTEFEVPNASSTSTSSVDHWIIVQGCWHAGTGVFTARVAIIFGVSQSVRPRAWTRLQTSGQLPSAMLVVDNEQSCQDRTIFLWCRPDVTPSWMRLLFEMSWGMLLDLTFPRKKFITVFNGVAFGLGEHAFAFPWPDFTNRLVWTGHEITSTGLITIGIMYSSPMSNGTVLTLQIDVFDCGEDVGSDFKMPICLNMTAMEEAPSWFGLISAEVDEQTHTSR